MIEAYIRPSYQRVLVDPMVGLLRHFRFITPIRISYFSGIAGLIAAMFIALHEPVWGVVWLLISGYCDTLDGSLARAQQNSSPLGTVVDITIDRAVEFLVIFALFAVDSTHRAAASMMMLGALLLCVTSFLVVAIFQENTSDKGFHYSRGLIERLEAFIFFIAMILLPQHFELLALVFTVLVAVTAVHRLWSFARKHR